MNIRLMEEKDIPGILELIIQYKNEQNFTVDASAQNNIRMQLANIMKKEVPLLYICILHDKIAGYINMHLCNFPLIFGSELYISDLLINQNHRGKGIGRVLLQKAEEIAAHHGCVRLMLNNSKNSESYSRSFYKKYGFTERMDFTNFVLKDVNESKPT